MSDLPKDKPTMNDAIRALGSSDKHNASQYIHNAEAKIKRLEREAIELRGLAEGYSRQLGLNLDGSKRRETVET